MRRENGSVPERDGARGGLSERRRFGRRDTCLEAMIVTGGGETRRCLVVNRSQGGAALRILDAGEVPDRFLLAIVGEDTIAPCRVAHRTDGRIGVEFISLSQRASSYFEERGKRLRDDIRQAHRKRP